MSFRWIVTPTEAWVPATEAYIAAIRRAVLAIAQRRAPEIEAWMKANAVWTDRTGNARQTLNTDAQQVAIDMIRIFLAGGVDYQVYLELSNAGRFAIIGPALDHWGPIIWADVQALMAA
jgi:type II secretory pathway component PulM